MPVSSREVDSFPDTTYILIISLPSIPQQTDEQDSLQTKARPAQLREERTLLGLPNWVNTMMAYTGFR